MAFSKTNLARAGTMELTANEGISYLESANRHTLLRVQGLIRDDKPAVQRDGTMESTTKAAEYFLQGYKPHADAQTRFQQKEVTKSKRRQSSSRPSTKGSPTKVKVKLTKHNTIAMTAKEGKYLLAGKTLGKNRKETIKKNADKAKRLRMRKTAAMVRTVEEARYVLGEDHDMGEGRKTRSQSHSDSSSTSSSSTSSSLSPRTPPMKRFGTMQQTASAGQEFLDRTKWKLLSFM